MGIRHSDDMCHIARGGERQNDCPPGRPTIFHEYCYLLILSSPSNERKPQLISGAAFSFKYWKHFRFRFRSFRFQPRNIHGGHTVCPVVLDCSLQKTLLFLWPVSLEQGYPESVTLHPRYPISSPQYCEQMDQRQSRFSEAILVRFFHKTVTCVPPSRFTLLKI